MLPSGIYLWETGCDVLKGSDAPGAVASRHELWNRDVSSVTSWKDGVEHGFLKADPNPFVHCDFPVVICSECSSTMEVAHSFAKDGLLPEWGSVVAVSQKSGRGQMRRHWTSRPGNLFVSLVFPSLASHADAWADSMKYLLPLVAGYVFSSALEQVGAKVMMKWPNDFYQSERKVGGMLLEEKNGLTLLGLGVNMSHCPDDCEMRKNSAAKAGILKISQGPETPLQLWLNLVNRGKNIYEALIDAFSPSEFISLAVDRLAWVGRKVSVHEGGDQIYQARIKGLSQDGGLILDRNGRKMVLYSGSILPA